MDKATSARTPAPVTDVRPEAPALRTAIDQQRVDLRMVFQPKTLDEAVNLAGMVAKSQVCPRRYQGKPEDVFVAAAYGAEIGLTFLQSVQGVVVIDGIPSIYGDHAIGLVRASGLCLYVREWIDDAEPKNLVAHCVTHRRGEPEPVERTFSEDDADAAKLLKKEGPWQTHLKRMLQMRARGFCLRDVYPDVLRGLRLFEEFIGETLDGSVVVDESTTVPEAQVVEQELPMPQARAEMPGDESEPQSEGTPQGDPPDALPGGKADEGRPLAEGPDFRGFGLVAGDPEPKAVQVVGISQRTAADGSKIYTISLQAAGPGREPVLVRTRDRALAVDARQASREQALVVPTLGTDEELGLMLVSLRVVR